MKNGEENWMVVGYFNTPLSSNEKSRGKIDRIQLTRMEDLWLFIGNTRLMDLKFHGTKFA